jgi:hypothetical protein
MAGAEIRLRRASLLAGVCLLPVFVHAAAWEPNEALVSSTADLLDPEFSQSLGMLTWSDQAGRLWVANVDRATGEFLPADGHGTLVDPYVAMYADATKTYNGPEWVSTANGDQIVYTKFSGNHTEGNGRLGWAYQAPNGGWIAGFLGPDVPRLGPYGSKTNNDPAPRISYFDNRGRHLWRELWNPATEQVIADFPASKEPVRHVIGARSVVYTKTVNGTDQAFVRDFDTAVVTQLTFDPGMKREVWIWRAPEFGGELLFSVLVDDSELRVYRAQSSDGAWVPIYSQTLAGGNQIYSPEPFAYNGSSYIFFAVQLRGNNFKSEIWISNIDASAPLFKRISDNTLLRARTDPEVFITDKGPMIYYNRFVNKGTVLRPKACIKVECSEGIFRADPGLGRPMS